MERFQKGHEPKMEAWVTALARDGEHRFSKQPSEELRLLAGLGVEGDAHSGRTVRHLSRIDRTPEAPNLRQVHLIHGELFEELASRGFSIEPGQLGENVTTNGIDLLGLSRGARLLLGGEAMIEITGLRNPCRQIDGFAPGLMRALLEKASDGSLMRKAGVMAVVVAGGEVRVGDRIQLSSLPARHHPLEPV